MADSDCIIVHEQVVVPDAAVVEEMVALPGEKGDKGDPFTYDDFTPEQIADLQRPATEAAAVANQAAENANKATSDIKVLSDRLTAEEAKRESAESGRASAESERAEAEVLRETSFSQMQTTLEGLITDTRTATSNANTAAGNAENAATAANNSATLANEAAYKANQAAQNVDGRITSLEEKASEVYENLAAIEASGETDTNKIYIDGETMQPYIYKGGSFVPFKGENDKYYTDNVVILFYKGENKNEFAIPLSDDYADLLVITPGWYFSVKRIIKGSVEWECKPGYGATYNYYNYSFTEKYLFSHINKILYQIDLSDGSFVKKEFEDNISGVAIFNSIVFIFFSNKIIELNIEDLSVVNEFAIDSSIFKNVNVYDDRIIIVYSDFVYVKLLSDNTYTKITEEETNISSCFLLDRTIWVNNKFYTIIYNGKIKFINIETGNKYEDTSVSIDTVYSFIPAYMFSEYNSYLPVLICKNGYGIIFAFYGNAKSSKIVSYFNINPLISYYQDVHTIQYYVYKDRFLVNRGGIMYSIKIK